ncbi:MAG: hypothetical protein AAF203_07620 [Pseudomonadota bacterium]
MFFSDKSDLSYLNFQPKSGAFLNAQIEWRGVILNTQSRRDLPIVDLSEQNLADVLVGLFPQISFVELARLSRACDSISSLNLNLESLFGAYNMHWNQKMAVLLNVLAQQSPSFEDWCIEKKLSAQDLMPLLALTDQKAFVEFSELFWSEGLSRSEGKQCIDWLVDLLLLGKSLKELKFFKGAWKNHLRSLRYPNETNESKNTGDHWPKFVQVSSFRHGDRKLQKLQITFQDDKDLQEKLGRLQKMNEGKNGLVEQV